MLKKSLLADMKTLFQHKNAENHAEWGK